MSRGNSVERARQMMALGAEVVLVDQLPGSPPGQVSGGDLAKVEGRAAHRDRTAGLPRGPVPAARKLPGALPAHRPQILRQAAGIRIDAFCDFAGTGGSFAGCAAAFRSVTRTSSALPLNPPAPRLSPEARSLVPITASREAVIPSRPCRCSPSSELMKLPRSDRRRSDCWRQKTCPGRRHILRVFVGRQRLRSAAAAERFVRGRDHRHPPE